MRRLLLVLFLGFAVLATAMPAGRAAETVPVRNGLHEGFGRIVFDWPRRIGYEARIEADGLVISFAEAASFDGPLLAEGLLGYAGAPQVSEDGRRLTLPLSGAYELKHFRSGAKIVIDLQQPQPAGAEKQAAGQENPGQPEAPAAAGAATEPPRIRVRAGRHDDFTRLVFDWPDPVGNVVEEVPGRARIVFDRPAAFDTSAVRPDRLPQIASLTADSGAVTLGIAEGSRLRVSRSGPKVVVDVYGQDPTAAKAAAPAPEGAGNIPETTERETAKAEPVADLTPRPEPGHAAAAVQSPPPPVEAEPAKAEPEQPAPAETAPDKSATGKAAMAAPAGPAAAPTPLVPRIMGGEAADAPPADTAGAAAKAAAPAPAAPSATAAKDSKPAADSAEGFAAAPVQPEVIIPEAARGRLAVRTEPMPSFVGSAAQGPKADAFVPVVLTFSWERPTAAAAFRRGENLWLVFDRPAPRNVAKEIAATAPHLGEVRLFEQDGGTILVIRAVPTVTPRLSREGSRWTVDLRPRSSLPERGLAAPVIEGEGGSRVRYPVVGAGRMLWITDPDAGDRLVVVPTRGAGMGLALPYGFPQFRSLQSQQGIVLQPLTTSIEVATIRNGVLVRDRDGLLVSKAEERRNAPRAADPATVTLGLFDLEAWRRGGIAEYQDNRQALQSAMSGLEGERLGIARLALARFYFAHGLDSETLGSVRVIEAENTRLAQDPEVRLMKGASQLLLQDYRGAAVSLAHPALAGEREALLWQAALAAQAEDWQAAATGFAATRDLIDAYPRNVRLPLELAAAEAFLRSGDTEAATVQLGAALRRELNDKELAQVKVIQGSLQLARDDPDQARKLWSDARDGPHRPSQARARLALIELGMQEESLSTDAAIAELERLRFAWRGDLFEFTLLRKLADLYVQQNRHRDALYALREAVTNFPEGPTARNSAQRMREIFTEIYRQPGDPDVPPLRALALYQEFMELTPAGPEGDRMIAGLADRLVEVDLLDRAAELLEGQVRYRLEGPEKARIGSRLALVQLLDRNPEASLEALDVSEVEGIDSGLALQRRQLRARALAELDRPDEALGLLKDDDSLDAEQLRADIHWQMRQWADAVASLSKLIPLLPPRRAMEVEESQLVVNLAVALMLAGQSIDLEDLNRRYGAAMAKGPHGDTFKLLVGDGEKIAISSIADQLSKVGQAQDFMANYRERLRGGALSQVN
jgi:tetratricopeptide (TPR) repeat protein